jgi:thiamine kinase-like enzyme
LAETLSKYKYQGWMSTVFVVKSNKGPLIIHAVNPVKEHLRNKVWNKFYGLSKILSSHPEIPTPKILYSKLVGKTSVLVQNFSSGSRAGKRVLIDGIISDKWSRGKKEILPYILLNLAKIHKINFRGFGWPLLCGHSLRGGYLTWKNFFESNYPTWIKKIYESDSKSSIKDPRIKMLDKFIKETIDKINYSGPSVLVHGDSINPSNILIGNKNKITLLDWEWSIAADPAWEFCDLGWWKSINIRTLEPYFKASRIRKKSEKIDFLNRIRLYIPLWLLWGAYMHSNDSEPTVYISLRKLLSKIISERWR